MGSRLGDIVAIAGRGLSMMVVSIEPPFVIVSWKRRGKVHERQVHASKLVLLRRAPQIVKPR
jgi:hypothetical protein